MAGRAIPKVPAVQVALTHPIDPKAALTDKLPLGRKAKLLVLPQVVVVAATDLAPTPRPFSGPGK